MNEFKPPLQPNGPIASGPSGDVWYAAVGGLARIQGGVTTTYLSGKTPGSNGAMSMD